jgi:uncharacterized protein
MKVKVGEVFAGWAYSLESISDLVHSCKTMKSAKLKPRFTFRRLRVGRSPIQGQGVFADEDIPGGQRVIEYTGERISHREAVKRFEKIWQSRNKRIYHFFLSKRWMVDGAVGGSGAELINHSCEPNLRTRRIRGHIFYFSLRRIPRGDELTLDYRLSKMARRVVCRCGSPGCRGTINLS